MKKKNKKVNIEPVIIVYGLFLFFSILFIFIRNYQVFHIQKLKYNLKTTQINDVKIDYPKFNIVLTDKIIKNLLNKDFKLTKGEVSTYINILNNRYITLFFEISYENNISYKSYILDAKKNKFTDINFLVKKNKEKILNDKIIEMLKIKYPEFIVNGILNSEGKRYYKIKNNELIIYYKDFQITPSISENIFVQLNYNEIKDIINIDYKYSKNYINQNIPKINLNKPIVIFTFDDGPSPITTPQMLDVLKANKAHATFFELGSLMERYPDITKRAINEGHSVGSHSYQHINLAKATIEKVQEQVSKTEEIYKNIVGQEYKFFRVPYGSYNQMVKDVINHPIIIWNEDPRDWESRNADQIVNMIMNNLHDGSMYVMHDIYPSTVEAIKRVLPEIYAKGYQVISLDEVEKNFGKTFETHIVYRNVK